jgi:hypothetical protein
MTFVSSREDASPEARIDASEVLPRLGMAAGDYSLATLHRAEIVDDPARLAPFLSRLEREAAVVHSLRAALESGNDLLAPRGLPGPNVSATVVKTVVGCLSLRPHAS